MPPSTNVEAIRTAERRASVSPNTSAKINHIGALRRAFRDRATRRDSWVRGGKLGDNPSGIASKPKHLTKHLTDDEYVAHRNAMYGPYDAEVGKDHCADAELRYHATERDKAAGEKKRAGCKVEAREEEERGKKKKRGIPERANAATGGAEPANAATGGAEPANAATGASTCCISICCIFRRSFCLGVWYVPS